MTSAPDPDRRYTVISADAHAGGDIADYRPYLPAARADFLRRLGDTDAARTAYREALALTGNEVERQFLTVRLGELDA